jgi:hypothetical protein
MKRRRGIRCRGDENLVLRSRVSQYMLNDHEVSNGGKVLKYLDKVKLKILLLLPFAFLLRKALYL